ncbi:ABC transporter permease [Lichenibacterium dinghuense]|uniref:ABC transporter permease n=1 Tax=Lichenibacterium dinghuense TaxID=2895977 RepID=UPI001F4223FF|nr:tetratricopeptide repeat protein [Lichenibacterium sp. 6Y81]
MTVSELPAPVDARDAVAAFRRRDFAAAAARFEAAAALAPGDAAPRLCLARALAAAGRLVEARRACEDAARLDPADLRAALFGARLAARADDGRGRIAHLKAAAALRPAAVALRLQLAAALGRRLQHRPALAAVEEALALRPDDPAVCLAAARCHLALGGLGAAEAQIARSGAGGPLEPERERLRADLALRRAREGEPTAAGAGAPLPAGVPSPPVRPRPAAVGAVAQPAAPAPVPPRPADVEAIVTAATLRAIARARRRPRLTDHLMVLRALVLRDLRAHHRSSALGVLVELVRPAVVVFVHYWMFYLLRKPMPGQIPIEAYVLAGFSVWFAFQSTWSGASVGGKWPGGATAWPGVTDMHLRLAKAGWGLLLNLAFCMLALLPLKVLGADDVVPNVRQTFVVFAMAGGSGFGLGLVLEGLGRRLAFVKTVEKLLTWGLFITSGLYFSIATTPPLVARYYWYNPLLHLLEHERHAFDAGYPVGLVDLRYPAMFTVGLLVTGLLVYRSAPCPDHD